MLKVWGRASSSNVQALMWTVEELGLEFERQDVGFIYGGNDTAEFISMNPNGTVPVVQDGDEKPIWESGAILRYLATAYGSETFWPGNPAERVVIDQWAEWSKLNIALNFTMPLFWRVVRTAPSKHDTDAIRSALNTLTEFLKIAEQQLGDREFIASRNFSLADVQFGHLLYRYFDIEIERANLPNLHAYYTRLCERPAFMTHVAISYEELRVTD